MYFKIGRAPSQYAYAVVVLTFIAANAIADSRVPLTLFEAEDIAMSSVPGAEAFAAKARAYTERSVAAGQLPDPILRAGLANYPIEGGSFSTEGMTQAQLGIRQSFPKGESRSFATSQLESLADEQSLSAKARSREVLAATRTAWLEAYYWQRAKQVYQGSRPFFVDLLKTTRSMYAVGRKTQYDVLRAEFELSRLDDRLLEADYSAAAAQARMSQWLSADAYRPPAMKLPDWEELPTLTALRETLLLHPRVLASNAAVSSTQAGVSLAEENRKPGWALDVGYGYREGRLPDGRPRSDFMSVSVSVDLPLFRKNRQDRYLAAALSEKSSAMSSRDRVTAELRSRLELFHSRWLDLGRRMRLYETSLLILSSGQAEAAMRAYKNDVGSFSDVMLAYIDDLDKRLEHVRIRVERAQTYAEIANLGGLTR